MKRLIILGAGTAGTIMANLLRRRLAARRVGHHRHRPRQRALLPARVPVHPLRLLQAREHRQAAGEVPAPRRRIHHRRSGPDRPGREHGRLPGRKRPPLRLPHRRDGGRDRPRRNARHARRLARHDPRLLHARRRDRPGREAQILPGRPDRHPRQRDAHQVPGRAARVRLLLRRLPAPPSPPRQDRARLRDAAARRVHQARRLEDARRDARGEAHRDGDRLQRRAHRRRGPQDRRLRRPRGPLRPARHGPDEHGLGDDRALRPGQRVPLPADRPAHAALEEIRAHLRHRRRDRPAVVQGRLGGPLPGRDPGRKRGPGDRRASRSNRRSTATRTASSRPASARPSSSISTTRSSRSPGASRSRCWGRCRCSSRAGSTTWARPPSAGSTGTCCCRDGRSRSCPRA
ncbi:MAG: hypothetical protein MZU84_08160 [Sphingobacterium sp.]|nr:hypothetical protein [Sphingobacterium sp.]